MTVNGKSALLEKKTGMLGLYGERTLEPENKGKKKGNSQVQENELS